MENQQSFKITEVPQMYVTVSCVDEPEAQFRNAFSIELDAGQKQKWILKIFFVIIWWWLCLFVLFESVEFALTLDDIGNTI